jgi:hemolysin activation/secretion protein
MGFRRAWIAGVITFAGAAVAAPIAVAQSSAAPPPVARDGASGLITSQQLNPSRQSPPQRRRSADLFAGAPKEVCLLPDDPKLRFVFQSAEILDEGHVLSPGEARRVWAGLVGKTITPHALCEVADRISERVFQRGVLARVVIPQQTIEGGKVRFEIIEAKITSIQFLGDIGPSQALAESYLGHVGHGKVFDLLKVQRWLLLINDIPGVRATAKIAHSTEPGAGPGDLDLVVTLSRAAIDEFASVQNTNSDNLGPWNAIARVDLNSLTGLGDRTSIIAYSTLGNNDQRVVQVLEQARIGDSGLYGQASFAYGRSRPRGTLAPLDLTGNSYVGIAELDYPLLRRQAGNIVLGAGMDFINQQTTFPGGQALSDDSLRVPWVRVDGSFHDIQRPLLGSLVSTDGDLNVQVRKGVHALGASADNAPSLSRPAGQSDAWVVRSEAVGSVRIEPFDIHLPPVILSVHGIAQWADRPLLAYEQEAIGNLTIGRGYDPDSASGDRLYAGEAKAELGPISLLKVGRSTSAQDIAVGPYGFYDIARVINLAPGSVDNTVHSVGGGLEFRLPYRIHADVYYAVPLDKAFPEASSKPPDKIYVQIVFQH